MAQKQIPPLYIHQQENVDFIKEVHKGFITDDPGCGKSRSVIEAFDRLRQPDERMLVLCPKSIMQPSWGDDIESFNPNLTYGVYDTKHKNLAFILGADITIANHDAVKWIAKNPELLTHFNWLIVDEFTAYKHRTSQRSKALASIRKNFDYRILLSGTPNSNEITDIWHPSLIVNDGELLGTNFFQFRSSVCAPRQVGPSAQMVKWEAKPGAVEAVADLLRPVTIRHKLEEVLDMPEHIVNTIKVQLPKKQLQQYNELREQSILELEDTDITAVNAAVRANKLLQLCSGAVYDEHGEPTLIHTERYELVMELVQERQHTVVVVNWHHQTDYLTQMADNLGLTWGRIDGKVSNKSRTEVINNFQKGEYKVVFIHPASAAHGVTLTKGTTTIWASPTYNLEYFVQANHRIYRAGQTKRTETILIEAEDTMEGAVYQALNEKNLAMTNLLTYLNT